MQFARLRHMRHRLCWHSDDVAPAHLSLRDQYRSLAPLMFAFLIFDIGRDIEAISDVVMAVTTGMKQVFQIFVLACLLGYVGAILLYLYLNNYPPDDAESERDHLCSEGHLISCMFLLLSTGGDDEDNIELQHISKNLAYQWIIYIVFSELISAIIFSAITDGFDELRGRKEEAKQDQMDKCYICGLDNNEFSRLGPEAF